MKGTGYDKKQQRMCQPLISVMRSHRRSKGQCEPTRVKAGRTATADTGVGQTPLKGQRSEEPEQQQQQQQQEPIPEEPLDILEHSILDILDED